MTTEENDPPVVSWGEHPIFDALAGFSQDFMHGSWCDGVEYTAWHHFANGLTWDDCDLMSCDYERTLGQLVAIAELCVPHGWWPWEIETDRDEPQQMEQTPIAEWIEHLKERRLAGRDFVAKAAQIRLQVLKQQLHEVREQKQRELNDPRRVALPRRVRFAVPSVSDETIATLIERR